MTTMTTMTTETKPLTPAARAYQRVASGTAVRLGDQDWILAGYVPAMVPAWDRIYDGNLIYREYSPDDLRLAAFALIRENYDLSIEEAVGLIRLADLPDLRPAVEAALFGPAEDHRTYGQYVEAMLYAAGLDPAKIPGRVTRGVLDVLVHRGFPSEAEFVSSAEYLAKRSALLNFGKDEG